MPSAHMSPQNTGITAADREVGQDQQDRQDSLSPSRRSCKSRQENQEAGGTVVRKESHGWGVPRMGWVDDHPARSSDALRSPGPPSERSACTSTCKSTSRTCSPPYSYTYSYTPISPLPGLWPEDSGRGPNPRSVRNRPTGQSLATKGTKGTEGTAGMDCAPNVRMPARTVNGTWVAQHFEIPPLL